MTKAPIPTEKLKKKSKWQHKNATKNFYYITIADRLRTMSFREVTQLMWLTRMMGSQPSHKTRKLCNQKDTHLKIYK